MFDDDLVTLDRGHARPRSTSACKTIAWLSNRFGGMPLYARIDMVSTSESARS